MTDNVYQTDSAPLAVTLSLLGVPPPKTERGFFPQLMIWTLDQLKGFGFSGMNAFDAARRARREQRSGTRVYQFERSERLERIVSKWKECDARKEAGDASDVTLDAFEDEDVVEVCYRYNEMRREKLSGFKIPGYLVFQGDRKTDAKYLEANGQKTEQLDVATSRGVFSAVSIDAPEEIQREIRP